MDYHYHARLVVYSREQLAKSVLEGRLSLKEAAAEFRLSRQSAAKWVGRYRDHGVAGVERPEFASASFATRHAEGEDHGDRAAEAATLDRGADRAPAGA
jgi:transposase-like protein